MFRLLYFLEENEDLVFAKFMKAHKCYDLIPTSSKLVVFDTQLNVSIVIYEIIQIIHRSSASTLIYIHVYCPVAEQVSHSLRWCSTVSTDIRRTPCACSPSGHSSVLIVFV